jgi:hypothetical protein
VSVSLHGGADDQQEDDDAEHVAGRGDDGDDDVVGVELELERGVRRGGRDRDGDEREQQPRGGRDEDDGRERERDVPERVPREPRGCADCGEQRRGECERGGGVARERVVLGVREESLRAVGPHSRCEFVADSSSWGTSPVIRRRHQSGEWVGESAGAVRRSEHLV